MEVEMLAYPGSEARVEAGLSVLHAPGFCEGSAELCLLSIAVLVCLPSFDEFDIQNSKENIIISEFRNLSKDFDTVQRFYKEMESKKTFQCHSEIKNISSHLKDVEVFYHDPAATLQTKVMRFENKIILIGVIFKIDEELSILGECSIFKNNIVEEEFIKCLNTSISQVNDNNLSFERLSYWSLWAMVKCLYATKNKSCSPLCVKTIRNLCKPDGEECINGYSKIPVNVKYTTLKMKSENKFIKRNSESRCLYFNPCVNNVCGAKTCYTIGNGTYKCGSFNMSVFNENSGSILSSKYIQTGDILKCMLVYDEEERENVNKLNPDLTWVTKTYTDDITINGNRLLIKTHDYHKKINVSCSARFTQDSPPYMVSYQFKLYKLPTKAFLDIDNGVYVQINQRIHCQSDGYPRKHVQYQYHILTKNFKLNKSTMNSEYLLIPLNATLGVMDVSCEAKMFIGDIKQKFTPRIRKKILLINTMKLRWGKEENVIYPNTTITCDVSITAPKGIVIEQLEGPSRLIINRANNFKITHSLKGGQYSVLCTITTVINKSVLYHRKYTFQLYKRPTSLCLFLKPGFKRIVIICLHNGFPQERAITVIALKKAMKNQSPVDMNNSYNKILVFFENEVYNYNLLCTSKYEDITLSFNADFQLQDRGAIFFRGTEISSKLCANEIIDNNIDEKDRFWLTSSTPTSFIETKVCVTFICLINAMSVTFMIIHMYSLDKYVVLSLTVSSLSRRHCIIRLYKKLNEVALFRVKHAEYANTSLLRAKFEAYRSHEEMKD